ncbi:MAG: alkaline shock response membrane anchor protein AmaP [Chloroflexota bacterium]|nr:alkaline shock response membrane anchor protein AmaP [Chloroflexota bacterium]
MNALNKAIAMILVLVIAVGSVVVLLVAAGAMGAGSIASGWLEPQLEDVSGASDSARAAIVAATIAIVMGMLIIFRYEIVPYRRAIRLPLNPTGDVMALAAEGQASLTRDSVCSLSENVARSVHNVRGAKCKVRFEESELHIVCQATISMGSNVPELCGALQYNIKKTVEELTGLPIREIEVRTSYETHGPHKRAMR